MKDKDNITMKTTLLFLTFILISCSQTENPDLYLPEPKTADISQLYGTWQIEPDNSYREIEIYAPNLFKLENQYPYTITPTGENEYSLKSTIDQGLYFKIVKEENLIVYRWTDYSKETYFRAEYVKVK